MLENLTFPMQAIDNYLLNPLYEADPEKKSYLRKKIEFFYNALPQPVATWGKRLVTIGGCWYAAKTLLSYTSYIPAYGDILAPLSWGAVTASAVTSLFFSINETALQKTTFALMRKNPITSFWANKTSSKLPIIGYFLDQTSLLAKKYTVYSRNAKACSEISKRYTNEVINLAKEKMPKAFKSKNNTEKRTKLLTAALEEKLPPILQKTETALKKSYVTQLSERIANNALLTLGTWILRFGAVKITSKFFTTLLVTIPAATPLIGDYFATMSSSLNTLLTLGGILLWTHNLHLNSKKTKPKPIIATTEVPKDCKVSADQISLIYEKTKKILHNTIRKDLEVFKKSLKDISIETLLIEEIQTPQQQAMTQAPKKKRTGKQEVTPPPSDEGQSSGSESASNSGNGSSSGSQSSSSEEERSLSESPPPTPSEANLEKNKGHAEFEKFCQNNKVAKTFTFSTYKRMEENYNKWMAITGKHAEFHAWLLNQDTVLKPKSSSILSPRFEKAARTSKRSPSRSSRSSTRRRRKPLTNQTPPSIAVSSQPTSPEQKKDAGPGRLSRSASALIGLFRRRAKVEAPKQVSTEPKVKHEKKPKRSRVVEKKAPPKTKHSKRTHSKRRNASGSGKPTGSRPKKSGKPSSKPADSKQKEKAGPGFLSRSVSRVRGLFHRNAKVEAPKKVDSKPAKNTSAKKTSKATVVKRKKKKRPPPSSSSESEGSFSRSGSGSGSRSGSLSESVSDSASGTGSESGNLEISID